MLGVRRYPAQRLRDHVSIQRFGQVLGVRAPHLHTGFGACALRPQKEHGFGSKRKCDFYSVCHTARASPVDVEDLAVFLSRPPPPGQFLLGDKAVRSVLDMVAVGAAARRLCHRRVLRHLDRCD